MVQGRSRAMALSFVAKALVLIGLATAPLWGLYAWQDDLIFPAPGAPATVPVLEEGFLPFPIETPDGTRLAAFHHPAEPGEASVVVFHGNADLAAWQRRKGRALREAGFGVLLAEYRGYGASTGQPSEAGLLEDALASLDALGEGPVAVYGHSLGTALAVHAAAERPVAAVVLEAPFPSLRAVAEEAYPWLPVGLLLHHPFESDRRIGRVTAPVLILHGEADGVVGIHHGAALAALVPNLAGFRRYPRGGHSLSGTSALDDAVAFLRSTLSSAARERPNGAGD